MSWFKKDKSTPTPKPPTGSAGGGGQIDQMVRMLASAPEQQRVAMLSDRLAVFADQEQEARQVQMGGMLTAALELPGDEYQKIATARFKALQSLPADTQMMLMKSHAAAVKALPGDQRAKEMSAMKKIISDLPQDERAKTMAMMQNLGLMGGEA